MTFEYIPTSGFSINGKVITWGSDRQLTRKKLAINYRESDSVIDLASFTKGDPSENLIIKRDIYGKPGTAFSFFLNYDRDQRLESIEVYQCESLRVGTAVLKFGQSVASAAQMLSGLDREGAEVDGGEFLYPNLKVTIADGESMGADNNDLYYFYAAASIDHLLG